MIIFKKVLYTIHRMLGTILSILFLIWFLSGFVMIYHGFPKIQPSDKYRYQEVLNADSIDTDSLIACLPQKSSIFNLSFVSKGNQSFVEVKTKDSSFFISTVDYHLCKPQIPFSHIEKYAKLWNKSDVVRVDTLYQLEQWIPFGQLKQELPIYKFYFADKDKHQLYISSQSGEALQFTDQNSRFWAWVGAIPHWIYFTNLRQDAAMWKGVVIWLSGIGCIMCLSGLILGIRTFVKQYRKNKRIRSSYRKFAYKWHHILGFIFGLFVFTFVFSGMMSLAAVPQWIAKTHEAEIKQRIVVPKQSLDIKKCLSNYEEVCRQNRGSVKNASYFNFSDLIIAKVVIDDSLHIFNAFSDSLQQLYLGENTIRKKVLEIMEEDYPMTVILMNEYDNYYIHAKNNLPLPVYKIEVSDKDNSTFYINPSNGDIRYYNNNLKVGKWAYQALHCLNFKFMVDHPTLRLVVMWIIMIGGTAVSITGVWLSIKYLKRKIKRIINKRNNIKCQ